MLKFPGPIYLVYDLGERPILLGRRMTDDGMVPVQQIARTEANLVLLSLTHTHSLSLSSPSLP